MKVNETHHATAKAAFQSGKNTPQVQAILHKEGLTKSQANDCCRTARKQLGIYKKLSAADKARKAQALSEADVQANKKTKVDLDA